MSNSPNSTSASSTDSQTNTDSPDSGESRQAQPARRVFGTELNNATYEFTESEREQAPNYVLLPTGLNANRVLIAGTITEVRDFDTDEPYLQATVADTETSFTVGASSYQPDPLQTLTDLIDTAAELVLVQGKPDVYTADDGTKQVNLTAEWIQPISRDRRRRWALTTAARTADRLEQWNAYDGESDAPMYPYVDLAADIYDPDFEMYRNLVHSHLDNHDALTPDE